MKLGDASRLDDLETQKAVREEVLHVEDTSRDIENKR